MNTAVNFMYRDAENNKYYGGACFQGEVTLEQAERIRRSLHDGEFFVAEQVGVEPAYPWLRGESSGYYDGIDHPYMTLQPFPHDGKPQDEEAFRHMISKPFGSDLCLTNAPPTDGRTIEEFVQALERAREEGWNHSILKQGW